MMLATGTDLVRTVRWDATEEGRRALAEKEWIVTNGLGGYASGTLSGALTRRYHAYLVAALPTPFGRTVMLNYIWERIRYADGRVVSLHNMIDTPGGKEFDAARWLTSFRLEAGLPVWTFDVENTRIEKRVLMPHLQNTTHISYRLLSNDPVRLELRPLVAFRLHEAPVNHPVAAPYGLHAFGDRFDLMPGGDLPPLRMFLYGDEKAFTVMPEHFDNAVYTLEQNRGYECCGDLWTPGYFRFHLSADKPGTLVASTESWETIGALDPVELPDAEQQRRTRLIATAPRAASAGFAAEMILAADQFVITPAGRGEEAARARAAGDEVRTVIAGYHWFTDWGRDTMISLEGLTLCTGRQREAGYILRTFEARDLLQDVFVRAWERLTTFRGQSSLATWLHRLGTNVVLERMRVGKREALRLIDGDSVETETPGTERDADTRMDLDRALTSLPAGARTVFVLHDIEGYSHDEIAAMTGIAPGTARAQLWRARRSLMRLLDL